jgi:hypothetical protein
MEKINAKIGNLQAKMTILCELCKQKDKKQMNYTCDACGIKRICSECIGPHQKADKLKADEKEAALEKAKRAAELKAAEEKAAAEAEQKRRAEEERKRKQEEEEEARRKEEEAKKLKAEEEAKKRKEEERLKKICGPHNIIKYDSALDACVDSSNGKFIDDGGSLECPLCKTFIASKAKDGPVWSCGACGKGMCKKCSTQHA